MSTSEAFLNTFAAVEIWLRNQANVGRATSFYELVDRVARLHTHVRRYKDDLKEFADLRNAIVHERTDGHVIAEPNVRAVADFEIIRQAFVNPPKLIPKFQKIVKTRDASESIAAAVNDMREGSFSQLPVTVDARVAALLTSETIARWLASEIANDLVSLADTPISNVLPHAEDPNQYCFLPRSATVFDVLDRFEDYVSRGKDLDAILITDSGNSDQTLLGIVTIHDLPAALKMLGLRRVSTV